MTTPYLPPAETSPSVQSLTELLVYVQGARDSRAVQEKVNFINQNFLPAPYIYLAFIIIKFYDFITFLDRLQSTRVYRDIHKYSLHVSHGWAGTI